MSDVHANRCARKWFELRRGHVGTRPTYLNMSTSRLHVNTETRGTWREKERQNGQKSEKNKPLWINKSRHAEPSPLHFSCTVKHQTPRDTRGRCRDGCWGLEPITVRLFAGSSQRQLTSVQSANIQMWVWRRRWTTSFRGKKRSLVVRVSFCLFDIQNEKMIKKICYFIFCSSLSLLFYFGFYAQIRNMELTFVTLPWWRVYPPSFSSQTAFSEICGSIKSWWRSDDRAEEEAHTVHSSQDHWQFINPKQTLTRWICEWMTSFSHYFF